MGTFAMIKIAIALIVVIATITLLIKRHESRMVLFTSGVILCIIAGAPMDALEAFTKAIKKANIIEPIVAAMGFAYVLKLTSCDKHLVHALSKVLKYAGIFLVPGAVLITAFINISVTSAAGCSAAVGAVIIPLLMRMGVHPALAASTVLLGTYGSANLNPGYHQTNIVAEVSKVDVMEVIHYEAFYFGMSAIICAIGLMIVGIVLKEYKGYVPEDLENDEENFKTNPIKAIVPIVPVAILLILSNSHFKEWYEASFALKVPKVGIGHAMIIGSLLAFITCIKDVKAGDVMKKFCAGMGEGFSHVYGIIICAGIFVAGLNAMGFVQQLIDFMKSNPSIATFIGSVGTFALALITGSGDAAGIAFNQSVTIKAADIGLDPVHLGSVVTAVAGLGRSMSPIAGAAIICATYAKVNPIELAKRNALPTIIAAIVYTIVAI